MATGDIDNDGKIDVLYSHSEKKGYPVSWYSAKDPKKGPWIEHKIEAQFDFCQTFNVGDINKDGKEDVFVARFSRHDNAFPPPFPIVVYYNTGKGAGWVRQELADSAMYHGILGDLGSDGDLDIVSVSKAITPAQPRYGKTDWNLPLKKCSTFNYHRSNLNSVIWRIYISVANSRSCVLFITTPLRPIIYVMFHSGRDAKKQANSGCGVFLGVWGVFKLIYSLRDRSV